MNDRIDIVTYKNLTNIDINTLLNINDISIGQISYDHYYEKNDLLDDSSLCGVHHIKTAEKIGNENDGWLNCMKLVKIHIKMKYHMLYNIDELQEELNNCPVVYQPGRHIITRHTDNDRGYNSDSDSDSNFDYLRSSSDSSSSDSDSTSSSSSSIYFPDEDISDNKKEKISTYYKEKYHIMKTVISQMILN